MLITLCKFFSKKVLYIKKMLYLCPCKGAVMNEAKGCRARPLPVGHDARASGEWHDKSEGG